MFNISFQSWRKMISVTIPICTATVIMHHVRMHLGRNIEKPQQGNKALLVSYALREVFAT